MFLDFSNPAGASVSRAFLRRLVASFWRVAPKVRGQTLTVALVDAKTSRRLNRTYRGVDAATDVLSFPFPPLPGSQPTLGEVVICYPVAVKQAREYGHSVRQELAELLAHGLAHLAGYVHDTPKRAKRMRQLEAKVLRHCIMKQGARNKEQGF